MRALVSASMTNKTANSPVPDKVADLATTEHAIETGSFNLLGLFGSADAMRALVRLPGGRIKTVEPGSKLPGGRQVVAIDTTGVMVARRGQTRRFDMPRN